MECPLCKGTGKIQQASEAIPATKIGRILKEARETKHLSLRAAETATGLSNALISQIETAKIKNPSFNSLVNLCGIYGIPITSLISSIEGGQS